MFLEIASLVHSALTVDIIDGRITSAPVGIVIIDAVGAFFVLNGIAHMHAVILRHRHAYNAVMNWLRTGKFYPGESVIEKLLVRPLAVPHIKLVPYRAFQVYFFIASHRNPRLSVGVFPAVGIVEP